MKKIISFSLYGTDPFFLKGAVKNLELRERYYPGWTTRFYVSHEVPTQIVEELIKQGAEIIKKVRKGYSDGMFWRFLAAEDPEVDITIIRDCDSSFTEREVAAVKEWETSDKGVHIMRDHPLHRAVMMGGMWGAKKGAVFDIENSLKNWTFFNRRGCDQEFLKYVVYPQAKANSLIHTELVKYEGEEVHPFPVKRRTGEFVGAAFDFRAASSARLQVESKPFHNSRMRTYKLPYSFPQRIKSRLIIEVNHWWRILKR